MTQPPPPPPNDPPQQGGFGPPPGEQPPQQGGFGPPPGEQPAQQGGFGPPQDPPPGYGYPQAPQSPAPPTPPGYGYPQAPQAPQQPPGYGYPNAQPGAYGYGQQPGHGYPQPPTTPQPQAGGPGGGRRGPNAQLLIIVAAVTAIALIVGGGIWYSSSGEDHGKKDDTKGSSGGTGGKGDTGGTSGGSEKAPGDTASTLLFQVPMPVVKDTNTVTTKGSWLTDKAYVKSGAAEIVGYDPDKGTRLWTIKLPGPVCEASAHVTEDDRTAILYEPAMPTKADPSHGCSQVAAIDLDAGRKLWTKTVDSGDQPITFDNVTVSAHTAALGSTEGGAAFDIGSGRLLWSPKTTDTCYDAGYGGGAKLVAVRKCGEYDDRTLGIQTLDPASGKVISEYKMAKGIEYASVVSTDPLVVASDVGDSAGDGSGISDFFSIDNRTGTLRTRISAPGDEYAAHCEGISRIEYCKGVVAAGDRLYVPTEERDGTEAGSRTNEIVEFDLATGKQTGRRADAGDGYTISPLRMDGADLIAYKRPPYDKGGRIVSVGGGDFKETTLLENPATRAVHDAEQSMLPEYAEILYARGHLYMSQVFASKSLTGSGDKESLAIAFATGG